MQIRDHVFVIAGGASGLGAGAAGMLAEHGGKLVIADLNKAARQALADQLDSHFVKCDVSREDDARDVIETATRLGTLRGLVNCAGIAPAHQDRWQGWPAFA